MEAFSIGYYIIASLLNISFGAFFIFLRGKADPTTLTKSQRWGLTVLGMVFILNGSALIAESSGAWGIPAPVARFYDLVNLTAIIFSLVYPRPVLAWKRMEQPLAAMGILGFVLVLLPRLGELDSPSITTFRGALDLLALTVLPMILLWRSRNENSEQNRMVMTIIAWGFIFNKTNNNARGLLSMLSGTSYVGAFFGQTDMFLYFAFIFIIIYLAWVRRGHWGAPERFSIQFFSLSFAMGATAFLMGNNRSSFGQSGALFYQFLVASWTWMRPLLLAFGLLRYQLFGTALRVDKILLGIGWAITVVIITVFTGVALAGAPESTVAAACIGAAAISAYPGWLISKYVTGRLLPLGAGDEKANMIQQRSAYLLSLQTAVYDGEIGDDFDARILANLRSKLGISQREHQLLMSTLPKKVMFEEAPRIQELFLVLSDGRLVAHAGSLQEEKELVAGMLTAIRGFAQDSLIKGQKELDTVKYGDYTLVMESEGKLLLAALVLGPETSSVRVRLRDCLSEAISASGDVLRKWDGELEKVEPVKKLLAATLASA
jgi:hypothetical protein